MSVADALAVAAKAGNEAALAELLTLFEPRAHMLARRHGRNADRDELLSLAQVAAWQALRSWQPEGGPFMPYAWRSASRAVSVAAFALRTVVGGRRRHQRAVARGALAPPVFVSENGSPALAVEAGEDALLDRLSVASLLNRLSPRDRQLLTWRFGVDGRGVRTFEEIGGRLGINPSTALRRVSAALARLRRAAGVADEIEGAARSAA
jgi:RNA polymerase sigma factor (sigma-70 family)